MPIDQWYDAETRDAATARVVQRLATNPGDRHVFSVVAEEFAVDQQALRDWVAEVAPETVVPAKKAKRPKFSPVTTTRIVPVDRDAPADREERADGDDSPTARPLDDESPTDDSADGGRGEAPLADSGPGEAPLAEGGPGEAPLAEVDEAADPAAPVVRAGAERTPREETETASVDGPVVADDVRRLEAQVGELRRGNLALVAAMRVILSD
jgi:hypothetical protein